MPPKKEKKGIKLSIKVDGAASDPSSGKLGVGVVVKLDDKVINEISEKAGFGTNSEAEYKAIIRGLDEAIKLHEKGINYDYVVINSDSQFAIMQLKGVYKVKAQHLMKYYGKARELTNKLQKKMGKKVYFNDIKRIYNQRADELANIAIIGKKEYEKKRKREELLKLASKGIEVIPLSIFRRKGWEKLYPFFSLLMVQQQL
ncbi:MAG: ribonuclease HI family protein [Candidatus Thermoplasmatota archaeon]|nr:ribonuclease HI family protein [Candidatus Thermoplasmatota archaeon]